MHVARGTPPWMWKNPGSFGSPGFFVSSAADHLQMLAVLTGSYSQKGRASPSKPQRRCCNKGAAAHALGLAHESAGLLGVFWRVRRAGCGMLGGCGARGQGTQKFTRSANTFLIFGERIASRGIDGLGDRAGHGIPLHVMNGTAPNPWERGGRAQARWKTDA